MIGNTSRTNTKCPGTFKHLSIGNCTVHYFWQIDNVLSLKMTIWLRKFCQREYVCGGATDGVKYWEC